MKCLILTGGTGDHMWPISRKNCPKQFVYLDGKHSMFQETILRNMAFCDEFWIMSSTAYKNIVQSQLQSFTGLKYRCFYEEEGKMTAPPLLFACFCAKYDESFLVVSTDNVIDDDNYKEVIVEGRRLIAEGKLATIGVNKSQPCSGVGFLSVDKNGNVEFTFPHSEEEMKLLAENECYYMDTGILMGKVNVFLQEFEKCAPDLYNKMNEAVSKVDITRKNIIISKEIMQKISSCSIGEVLTTRSEYMTLLEGNFECEKVRSFGSLAKLWDENSRGYIIKNECNNVSVINFSDNQLVVGNDLEDLIIVNTADSVYISRKDSIDNIKSIIVDNKESIPQKIFDESPIMYTIWGYRENLQLEKNFWVRKVTVYPGCKLSRHRHIARSENWVILSGEATVLLENEWYDLRSGSSIHIERGMVHQLLNNTSENVIFIETAVGEILDVINDRDIEPVEDTPFVYENIVKMSPYCKEKLWGGTKLMDKYKKLGKGCNIAESWEISAHPNGQSVIATGKYTGMPFGNYLNLMGREILGWKGQFYDRFPILVKFIDARENLSVQVHPNDDYALANENQYGKNEMWYIVEAEPGACIYCGFTSKVSKNEIEKRTENNTLTDIMKAIPVEKGQAYFIPTGTVHAIGRGILLCEIQQNSDVTYRLYDYGRTDRFGNTRELHIKKALDVLKAKESVQELSEPIKDSDGEIICKCKYFTVERYFCNSETVIWGNHSSFTVLVVISGRGLIEIGNDRLDFMSGDSFFAPAGNKPINIKGEAEVLTVRM